MARPKNVSGKVRVSIGASVLPEIEEEITQIADIEGRTKSNVIEKLLKRGLTAYRRDGKLFDLDGEKVIHIAEIGEDHPTVKRSATGKKK